MFPPFSTDQPLQHELQQLPFDVEKRYQTRVRCVACYRGLANEIGSKQAASKTKRVTTTCNWCRKGFCLACFRKCHSQEQLRDHYLAARAGLLMKIF
jgi:hypothetical protein